MAEQDQQSEKQQDKEKQQKPSTEETGTQMPSPARSSTDPESKNDQDYIKRIEKKTEKH